MATTPSDDCATMKGLPNQGLERVAQYFQALSEPTRLQILNLLRQREHSVGELARLCGYTSANVSRHLAVLATHGLVARSSRGTSAYYRIADSSIYALCDLVCDRIARRLEEQALAHRMFIDAAAPPRTADRKARNRATRHRA